MTFRQALAEQRWDDHRYYHHNRVNQALHLLSALSFIAAYLLLFVSPSAAVLLAWLVAMPSRQIGHFFFEPHDYDHINQASHEHKEAIKVGYNLYRKVVLLTIWALSPLVLVVDPTFGGLFEPAPTWAATADQVARIWLAIAAGAVLFRTVQLFFLSRRADRRGVVHENPHRPVPRREALSPSPAAGPARRVLRSGDGQTDRVNGADRGAAAARAESHAGSGDERPCSWSARRTTTSRRPASRGRRPRCGRSRRRSRRRYTCG